MKFVIFYVSLFFIIINNAFPQSNEYLIYFADKDTSINLYNFFDTKAIERRQTQNIPFDYTDYPVTKRYVNTIAQMTDSVVFSLRWINAVWCYASYHQIKQISQLSFVKRVQKLPNYEDTITKPALCQTQTEVSNKIRNLLYSQIQSMQGQLFVEHNFSGKGLRMAVLDAGFTNANKSPFLAHLFNNGKIIKAYDFIRKDTIKYTHSSHGRMVLSCIAGLYNDTIPIGLAYNAEFLLARTEYNTREPFKEELFWMKAAEWADKNGADIISSSLGYTVPRYCKTDMDGHTSYVSKAALMAVRKGILVVISAGNSGSDNWRVIATPADADSILTVGGTECCKPVHINFSSVGPAYDGRLKPEVVANADVAAAGRGNSLTETYGTSFSAPLVAGFAACAWQTNRKMTNIELRQKIMQSGHLYPYFDYSHGYGIPQASLFVSGKKQMQKTNAKILSPVGNDDYIAIRVKDFVPNKDVIYYKVSDTNDKILFYGAVTIKSKLPLYFPKEKIKGKKVTIYLNGTIKNFYF